MNRTTAALLALTLAAPLSAQTPEALKAVSLGAALQTVEVPAAPQVHASAPVYAAQVRVYALGGFSFESDAQNASRSAQANLRAAGLRALRAEITRQHAGSWNFGFRIEYFENGDPLAFPREVRTTSGGDYAFDSDARAGLQIEENDLRARGYRVVLGEALKRSSWPYRYYYRVSFALNGAPAPASLHTSGVYGAQFEAQRGLNEAAAEFSRRGYSVWDERIYRDPSSRWYFFQFRYGARR